MQDEGSVSLSDCIWLRYTPCANIYPNFNHCKLSTCNELIVYVLFAGSHCGLLLSHPVYRLSWRGRNTSLKVPIPSLLAVEGVQVSGSDLRKGLSVGWLNQGNSQPCVDGITWLLIKPRALIKKAKPEAFFAVHHNAKSVSKSSFSVNFVQRKALGVYSLHCVFQLVEDYCSLGSLFCTCENTQITLHKFCC